MAAIISPLAVAKLDNPPSVMTFPSAAPRLPELDCAESTAVQMELVGFEPLFETVFEVWCLALWCLALWLLADAAAMGAHASAAPKTATLVHCKNRRCPTLRSPGS